MKNFLMTLLFLSGLASTQLSAQSCCTPCPPECCVKACPPGASNLKASNTQTAVACTPAQLKACKKAAAACSAAQPKSSVSTETPAGAAQTSEESDKPLAKKVALKEEE